ncbi:hypothetical protein GBAR_LOCUS16572 [Geodia barretti]|uniref:Uncharacterized protein n=1 Tax=Geodia barretti TaxID=519541 RepID=A0AA35SHR0_GEOBA|nr:hypothetical protein GBAR_LOCUS16572 [Geodia barretti]
MPCCEGVMGAEVMRESSPGVCGGGEMLQPCLVSPGDRCTVEGKNTTCCELIRPQLVGVYPWHWIVHCTDNSLWDY